MFQKIKAAWRARSLVLLWSVTMLTLISLAAPSTGFALPLTSGSTLVSEADGFPGLCAAPCFEFTLDYSVWADDAPDNPLALAGNLTYTYTITHEGGTIQHPNIPITGFELEMDTSTVASAGFIPGSGISPTSTTITLLDTVSWAFPLCPTCLDQGLTSDILFVHSTLLPDDIGGDATAPIIAAEFTTTGPVHPASAVPEPSTLVLMLAGLILWHRKVRV